MSKVYFWIKKHAKVLQVIIGVTGVTIAFVSLILFVLHNWTDIDIEDWLDIDDNGRVELEDLSALLGNGVTHPPVIPDPGIRFQDCDKCPVMVGVPTGSFIMGASSSGWLVMSMTFLKAPSIR